MPSKNEKLNIVIGNYLQCDDQQNEKNFYKDMNYVKKSNIDILVFPEFCWLPNIEQLNKLDIYTDEGLFSAFDYALKMSDLIGKAIVINTSDKYETIFSIYANNFTNENETKTAIYLKHTMTNDSPLELNNYQEIAHNLFPFIVYKDIYIGLTICYDCNHAIFSRMYGLQAVDIILNSTGGNVVEDKWYKYNQARAIENYAYTFCTMGGSINSSNNNSYTYGFNPNGHELQPALINKKDKSLNVPGGIYVYDLSLDDYSLGEDRSINQKETINKNSDLSIEVGNTQKLISQSTKLKDNLYVCNLNNKNLIIITVNYEDIFYCERFLHLMYDQDLEIYSNKIYLIYVTSPSIKQTNFNNYFSPILKVRAMENFCCVIFDSPEIHKCYQTGKNRTAQVLQSVEGHYRIDTSRMTVPEAIWKNKEGMRLSWRKNFTWLINKALEFSKSS